MSAAPPALPSHARAVVVGGGVIGCSVAYHLTRLGWRDVLLLEQGRLSCGTSWHAAGLVGRLRSGEGATRLAKYSAELYARLEAETGQATGWRRCGSLNVARTRERLALLRRQAVLARAFGIEAYMVDAAEVGRLYPVMRTDDLLGGIWLPDDGKVNPVDLVQALAKGARQGGARLVEGTRVMDIETSAGAVRAVVTTAGRVECEAVAVCTGMWSWHFGRRNGVAIPLHPTEHFYAVSERIDGVTADLPVLRDPDGQIYVKEEVGGLLFGGFETTAKPWPADPVPDDFCFSLLPDNWEQFEPLVREAIHRIPALETTGIKKLLNGPESFTPDNNYMLGQAPGLAGYFVAAGFNSGGIASAGGAGRALAQWIAEGGAGPDAWSVDLRRFAPCQADRPFLAARVSEVPGLHYRMAWPNREMESGRGLRRSPLHERLAAAGACFGEKMGFERPNWFGQPGEAPHTDYSFGRQNWFAAVAAEHRAAREAVAVFDQSSFAKFLVEGRNAEAVLQRVCSSDVALPAGRLVYTAMLNRRGGFEADLTVMRLEAHRFLLVSSSARLVRDADWIRRHAPPGADFRLTDVSDGLATIGVCGPASRILLGRLTRADLGNPAFPFGAVRELELAGVTAHAARMAYGGELGWELYVPGTGAGAVYDALMAVGIDLGVRNAGYYALDSLRLEKAYRAWGSDITPDDTPLEAGMAFIARLDKPVPFIGREALVAQKRRGIPTRLVLFVLEDPTAVPWGGEPVWRDDRIVGKTTSAAFGHTVGRPLAFGWIRNEDGIADEEFVSAGRYEIEIAGDRVPARPALRAPYDPEGLRRKG